MKDTQGRSKQYFSFIAIFVSLAGILMATRTAWGQEQPLISPTPESTVTTTVTDAQTVHNQVLFSIPIGDAGLLYEGADSGAPLSGNAEGEEDVSTWGPTALSLGTDGTFWVADNIGRRIRQFSSNGTLLTTIDTSGRLVELSDIAVAESGIFALDMTADEATLWALDLQGNTIFSSTLPLAGETGLTGITVDAAGVLWLEEYGGMYRAQWDAASVTLASTEEKDVDWSPTEPNLATLTVGSASIDIRSSQPLANVRLLQVTSSADVFVAVEEVVLAPEVLIDQTVRHYSADGLLLGTARVPIAAQTVHVDSNLAVAHTNDVYALVPLQDKVEVQLLEFAPNLPAILPQDYFQPDQQVFLPLVQSDWSEQMDPSVAAEVSEYDAAAACRTRAQMMETAARYAEYTYVVKASNTNSCPRRTPGWNMNTPGRKRGVAYKWGGFNSISEFQAGLDAGREIGDVVGSRDGGIDACSVGVDCSGFVSRVWGLQSKFTTGTLLGVSSLLHLRRNLQPGDIMNKPGKHVRVFAHWGKDGGKNGGYFYEATTGGLNRVVFHYLTWSAFYGYKPYRFDKVCKSNPPVPSPAPSWPICNKRPLLKLWDGYRGSNADKRSDVRELQSLLNQKHGYHLDIDGYLGPASENVIKDSQRRHHLEVDGIVGPQTWSALCR